MSNEVEHKFTKAVAFSFTAGSVFSFLAAAAFFAGGIGVSAEPEAFPQFANASEAEVSRVARDLFFAGTMFALLGIILGSGAIVVNDKAKNG